ncbi:hypothetical protein ACFV4N_15405 [Actinosynnema sp. NPDC059797]
MHAHAATCLDDTAHHTPDSVLALQRTVGNAAVSRLLTGLRHGNDTVVQRVQADPGVAVDTDSGWTVSLTAQLNGQDIGTWTSQTTAYSPQDHAEDQLIDSLEAATDPITHTQEDRHVIAALALQPNHQHTLRIQLSASPCSRARGTTTKTNGMDGCTERLVHLATHGVNGHTFAITLRAHHLYRPQNVPNAAAASQAAMDDLTAAGINAAIG